LSCVVAVVVVVVGAVVSIVGHGRPSPAKADFFEVSLDLPAAASAGTL
jgi:hypothetical protein